MLRVVSLLDRLHITSDYKDMRIDVPAVSRRINQDQLNLLTAYDKTGRREILDAALRLSNWLLEAGQGTAESQIHRINNLQTLKRMRQLTEEELQEFTLSLSRKSNKPSTSLCPSPISKSGNPYDPIRTLARQMARSHRLPGNQPPQTLQVQPGGTQHALLVEAQQEVDECRGVEGGEGGVVQAVAGVGREVKVYEGIALTYLSGPDLCQAN